MMPLSLHISDIGFAVLWDPRNVNVGSEYAAEDCIVPLTHRRKEDPTFMSIDNLCSTFKRLASSLLGRHTASILFGPLILSSLSPRSDIGEATFGSRDRTATDT
ncbi:unnamed protein product [Somion occarium]|uniref:Uncharacterized protein n=1 Tax=Somion occarium TaxID=3059160 RepID=A0ABP1DM49_9APHY